MKIKLYFDDTYIEPFKNLIYSAMTYKLPETLIALEIGLWSSAEYGLSPKGREEISRFLEKFRVEYQFTDIQYPFSSMVTTIPFDSSMAKLLFCLTATDNFIYMDVDMLCLQGWDEILRKDFLESNSGFDAISPSVAGAAIAAVPDSFHNIPKDPEDNQFWILEEGQDNDWYFNAGFFLFNSLEWKSDNLTGELTETLDNVFSGRIKTRVGDQDILNYVARYSKYRLPEKYNAIVTPTVGRQNPFLDPLLDTQPRILHFAGAYKPWLMDLALKSNLDEWDKQNSQVSRETLRMQYYYLYFVIEAQRKMWENNS